MNETNNSNENHLCGYAAIIGLPNAGKSTLINRYMKEKVSIVSPKPQTTRTNISCILSSDRYQIIFIDTPGILKPSYRMQEVMAACVTNAVNEADVILVIYDASEFRGKLHPELVGIAGKIDRTKIIVALNKIDLMKKDRLLGIIRSMSELFPESEIIPVSALTGDGTGQLLELMVSRLPESPSLFPDDIISDEPERFFVSEIIREAVFHTMGQEIPYSTAVIIDSFKEKTSKIVISATILVEKKSQKPIIIGKGGSSIKKIGTIARHGIEAFLGSEVYLDLFVKVRDNWRNKDTILREIGIIKR